MCTEVIPSTHPAVCDHCAVSHCTGVCSNVVTTLDTKVIAHSTVDANLTPSLTNTHHGDEST